MKYILLPLILFSISTQAQYWNPKHPTSHLDSVPWPERGDTVWVSRHFNDSIQADLNKELDSLFSLDAQNRRQYTLPEIQVYTLRTDTVKAVVLCYQKGPIPIQKNVWAIRTKNPASFIPAYPQPDNFSLKLVESVGYLDTDKYLDTDRKTPIAFIHIWQTAYINW